MEDVFKYTEHEAINIAYDAVIAYQKWFIAKLDGSGTKEPLNIKEWFNKNKKKWNSFNQYQ